MNIYDFKVRNAKGEDVSMADYKGKVLLIVNTATGCGFTPQYEGLQKLYDKYKEKGLVILDFPCNQFGHQAPGTEEEIQEFCTLKYKTTFPLFAKVEVNGDNQDPLFRFLKKQQGGYSYGKSCDSGHFSCGIEKIRDNPRHPRNDECRGYCCSF